MAERVFVVHAPEDARWADAIVRGLRRSGFDAKAGSASVYREGDWAESLRAALDRASTILVLVSAKAASSDSLPFEAGAALGASFGGAKRLVPVYLSRRSHDSLPLLHGLDNIDLSGLRPDQAAQRVAEFMRPAA